MDVLSYILFGFIAGNVFGFIIGYAMGAKFSRHSGDQKDEIIRQQKRTISGLRNVIAEHTKGRKR